MKGTPTTLLDYYTFIEMPNAEKTFVNYLFLTMQNIALALNILTRSAYNEFYFVLHYN